MASTKRAVFWFRRGLRLHDNPALLAAARESASLTPVFIINRARHSPQRCGRAKMKFLLESLAALDTELRARNSSLVVLSGDDEKDVLMRSMEAFETDALYFESAPEPHLRAVDEGIEAACRSKGIDVRTEGSHLVWDHDVLEDLAEGRVITQYQSFLKLLDRAGTPAEPEGDAPAALPGVCAAAARGGAGVPSLESLGFGAGDGEANLVPGGEKEGLARMGRMLGRDAYICEFEKPKTSPTALQPSTTVLSPYLTWGCLSPRRFYHGVLEVYRRNGGRASKPPTSLEGQILWREFYYYNGRTVPNYDRMLGNPICKQIPWTRDAELLEAWRGARTGYPWIDAAMTQLRTQGWIHHLARHAVACFLTRGDFWVHWELGRDVFDELLLDADWSLNNGNWMWLSASAYFHQYFRVYGPVSFAKKYDPEGKYVRHFLPVLKDMPKKYIYEPWTAPPEVQRAAKCVVGVDYPRPVVVHQDVNKQLIGRMAAAYKANKGSAPPPAATNKAKRARTT